MSQRLRVLLVEDSPSDAALLERELRRGGFITEVTRVETKEDFLTHLKTGTWDIVIADYNLPAFDGFSALHHYRAMQLDMPFLLISGTVGEEVAVDAMRRGANDYLLKDNFTRLVPAVLRELREASSRAQRRSAEQALRESEERFRELAETTRTVPWEAVGGALHFTYVGPQAAPLLGYSNHDWLEEGFWARVLHPDDAPLFSRAFREALDGSRHLDVEVRLRTSAEQTLWVWCVATFTDDGPYALLRGYLHDVTERKQAEKRLRASERRFATIFESTALPIVITALDDGRIVDVNRAATELVGYTRQEVVGRNVMEFGAWSSTEERTARIQDILREGGGPAYIERSLRSRDGRQLTVIASFSPTELDGKQRLLITLQDITQRKQSEQVLRESEERFRSLVENSSEPVVEVDLDGVIFYASPHFETLTGRPAAVLVGQPYSDLVHVDDRAAVGAALAAGRRTPPYRIKAASGERWFESAGRQYRTTAGDVRVVVVSRDISERRDAEAQQRALEVQLRQAQKLEAIGTLAGGLAHDFNNLLTGILGSVQLASLELPEDHSTAPLLLEAERACLRARDLISRLLSISRRQETELRPVALGPVIEEALRFLRSTLPASVRIRSELSPDCPPVRADGSQIHQVLLNLGVNAAQAMQAKGQGELTVRLTAERADSTLATAQPALIDGRCVLLTVSDTGCGMDAAVRERIFEPFFTTRPAGSGSGLGLAMVHSIVRGHCGLILVDSEPGHGTTFRVYLPAAPGRIDGDTSSRRPLPRGSGQRVLVIDDERSVAETAAAALLALGYKSRAVTDPRQALDLFRAAPGDWDVVLTDLTMPGLSGVEVARAVRLLRPDIPLVLATGYLRDDDGADLRAVGVDLLIQKPFTLWVLGESFAKVCAGRSNHQPGN